MASINVQAQLYPAPCGDQLGQPGLKKANLCTGFCTLKTLIFDMVKFRDNGFSSSDACIPTTVCHTSILDICFFIDGFATELFAVWAPPLALTSRTKLQIDTLTWIHSDKRFPIWVTNGPFELNLRTGLSWKPSGSEASPLALRLLTANRTPLEHVVNYTGLGGDLSAIDLARRTDIIMLRPNLCEVPHTCVLTLARIQFMRLERLEISIQQEFLRVYLGWKGIDASLVRLTQNCPRLVIVSRVIQLQDTQVERSAKILR